MSASDGSVVIARLAIGTEAAAAGAVLGALIVQRRGPGYYAVFVEGGLLPDGEDVRVFLDPERIAQQRALVFAFEAAHRLALHLDAEGVLS